MKLLNKTVFILLFITGISQGCIKENLAKCVFNINLAFEQNRACQIASQYPVDINRVDVFAFNHANVFVEQFTVLNPDLGPNFSMPISLPQGGYTLITWGGVNDKQLQSDNFIKGHSHINDLYISSFFNDENKAGAHNLYYGIKNIVITDAAVATQKINLTQDTKPLTATVNGLDDNNNYRIEVSNNAANFNFYNKLIPLTPADATISEPLQKDSVPGTYTAKSLLLWPMNDIEKPKLSIYNADTHAAIFSVYISDLLNKLPDVDFNCEDSINVKINYLSDAKVEVSINDWKVIYFNGEI